MTLSGNLWPYHPKPLKGEIFSSWLLRTAQGNASKTHSFCHQIWPYRQIWTRDIDRIVANDLLDTMATRTATPRKGLHSMFLQSFEGTFFEELKPNAYNSWIRVVGVRHRVRTRHGQLYCPLCLESDDIPYFRKIWRTNLSPVCLEHAVVLRDDCDRCQAPVMFHRGTMMNCSDCGYDLRDAKAWACTSQALVLARALVNRSMNQHEWHPNIPEIEPDVEFFATIRSVMTLLCAGKRTAWLRKQIANYVNFNIRIAIDGRYERQFECLRANDLHQVFSMASVMLRGWPWMFIGLCSEARLWKSWVLKDRNIDAIPTLSKIVHEYLYDPYQFGQN